LRTIWSEVSSDGNSEYRQFYLASDIFQAKIIIFFVILVAAFSIIGDYIFFGFSPLLYELLLLRGTLIGYSILQIRYLNRVKDCRPYDKSVLVYMLLLSVSALVINITQPENYITQIIIVDMAVLTVYLVVPTRFIYQALAASLLSIGEVVAVAITFQGLMEPAMDTALFSLLFANIVAALASLNLHSYRWRIYQTSQERKETDRLAAIGQTAGMIGHDIRNPLQAIVSELYIAKETMSDNPYQERTKPALESIALIEEQTDYITKIVSDLQDYARPLKPEIKEVDIAKLITIVFQTVKVPSNITLRIDVKDFLKIQTDPTLIRRALTNLVINGIQAMPDGGTLELSAYATEKASVLSVSDTGNGIPEEIKSRLFTPLVTTKAKGQGLGLAVVKRLVEALGGQITFESQLGKGTKFTISLPES
jgi:signal transduction histidine kinase